MTLYAVNDDALTAQWADTEFQRQAMRILKRLARRQRFLTVNEFWDSVERSKVGLPTPSDKRMLGKVFRQAASEGLIVNTNVAVRSARHGNYYRPVWESQVVGQ